MNMKRSITTITTLLLGLFVTSVIAQESITSGNLVSAKTIITAAKKPKPEPEEPQPQEETKTDAVDDKFIA